MPSASNWLGGMVGGLAGLGNALMMLRQMQQSDAQLQMKAQEGQGTFVPQAAPDSSFLQRLLSISPPGSLQLGNQSYGFQPHPMLGEEGARALGLGIPAPALPEGVEGPPAPEAVPTWAAEQRMDPKTRLMLMQQQMIGQRAEAKAKHQQQLELEKLRIMFGPGGAENAFGGGAAPAAPTAPPGPPALPPVAAPAPASPQAPVALPPGAPAPAGAVRLPDLAAPPGYAQLSPPQQQEWVQRETEIERLRQAHEQALTRPKVSATVGGFSVERPSGAPAMQKRIDALQKVQDDLLKTARAPSEAGDKVTSETTARLETTQDIRGKAVASARTSMALGNFKAAEDALIAANIQPGQYPQEMRVRFEREKSQLKSNEKVASLQAEAEQHGNAAKEAWKQLNLMAAKIFTTPGGAIWNRLLQRAELEAQAVLQDPTKPDVATYEDSATAHIITITKALTGTGRMAYAEVLQMLKGLPTVRGRGGLPDSQEVAQRKMDVVFKLLESASKHPINPNKAHTMVDTNPAERDPAKRWKTVPLAASGGADLSGLSTDELEQRIQQLESGGTP